MPRNDDESSETSAPEPYRSEKARPSIFWVLAAIIRPIGRMMMKLSVEGAENLPKRGPFILAPNHYSEIDPVVIGIATWKMGRVPRFMAKASLFRIPVVGWFLRRSGQIPVERAGSKRGSGPVEAAGTLVNSGGGVIVYPEGSLTRDPDLWPMRGKTGAARMALAHSLPVYPVAHWGTQRVLPRYGKRISFFPPKPIHIRVGEAVDLSAFEGKHADSATLNEATSAIMDAITAELERVRGEKAPAERWNPAQHNQKETGRFES